MESLKGRDILGDIGIDGRISNKMDQIRSHDLNWLRIDPIVGFC
jgi:hypothetical protein